MFICKGLIQRLEYVGKRRVSEIMEKRGATNGELKQVD
jgi:hypothetical protein